MALNYPDGFHVTKAAGADLTAELPGTLLMNDGTNEGRVIVTAADTDVPGYVLEATPRAAAVGTGVRCIRFVPGFEYELEASAGINANVAVAPTAAGQIKTAATDASDALAGMSLVGVSNANDMIRVRALLVPAHS